MMSRYEEQVKSIESHRADEVNKMQLLLDLVEAVKDQVKQLAEEVEIEKINSTEAADELSVWEERVKSCKETQNIVSQEKVILIYIWLSEVCLYKFSLKVVVLYFDSGVIYACNSGTRGRIRFASKRCS